MSFYHDATGTTYDVIPNGLEAAEFRDIGERPSVWHYWDAKVEAWLEDVVGKAAAQKRGF